MENEATIHFGFDESNHCPHDKKKFEIIVATASIFERDGKIKALRRKRNAHFRDSWMNSPEKYWVFTLLTFAEFTNTPYNLVLVAPTLVDRVLKDCTRVLPDNCRIKAVLHMDGKIDEHWAKLLHDDFKGYFDEPIDVRPYKKIGARKVVTYPNVVHAADNIANYILGRDLKSANQDPKYAPLSLETLLSRKKILEEKPIASAESAPIT